MVNKENRKTPPGVVAANTLTVLFKPRGNVICHASVERAVTAFQDVEIIMFVTSHVVTS